MAEEAEGAKERITVHLVKGPLDGYKYTWIGETEDEVNLPLYVENSARLSQARVLRDSTKAFFYEPYPKKPNSTFKARKPYARVCYRRNHEVEVDRRGKITDRYYVYDRTEKDEE